MRPPYEVPDQRFEHLRVSNVDVWLLLVRLDRVAALNEPPAGLEVGAYEHLVLERLADTDTSTVAAAALLHRARAAAPLAP